MWYIWSFKLAQEEVSDWGLWWQTEYMVILRILLGASSLNIITDRRDLERIESPVYSVKAHDQIVNVMDGIGGLGIGGGAPELVTGSRDGK